MEEFKPIKTEKTVISIRLDVNMLKNIDDISAKTDISRNEFIIQCIDSILMDETIALPALQSITLGAFAFGDAPSVIMEGSRQ